jgi:serine O-acetyltransferase
MPVDRKETLTKAAAELSLLLEETVPDKARHEEILLAFFDAIPEVARMLESDVQAAYEGDPAARTTEEIMLSYPSFEAISIYRIAHVLYTLGVPLIPRMMTEQAHSTTGIDIHPGATIGEYFFIDHGTGVVVGETCVIGHHVKLYQGVTLGAKSFACDEGGNPVKGVHRHPRVGNNVVIYAGATILGGDTCIGDGCTIGGSVWLTKSVPAGSTIYNK